MLPSLTASVVERNALDANMVDQASSTAPTLEHLISLWPVATTLSKHLPVGDLINLSRMSAKSRAVLHGFEVPSNISIPSQRDLHIGHHNTPSWSHLKALAPLTCSSAEHTKGPTPKGCRYCSRPICGACMVRDSLSHKGHENTFPYRIRHLCKTCWEEGNPSRSRRFPLKRKTEEVKASAGLEATNKQWYSQYGPAHATCECTLIHDGTLCLDCKSTQNTTAISPSASICHAQGCNTRLTEEDFSLRRICLWCDNPLPRQTGGTTRYHWTRKIIQARARNAASRTADVEEWNRQRARERTMSRREMRGDHVDSDHGAIADAQLFVRHLDTVNYKNYMHESSAPTPEAVFASKNGYWRYSRGFLLAMQTRCILITPPSQLASFRAQQLDAGGLRFARTNGEKAEDLHFLRFHPPKISNRHLTQLNAFKAVILEYFVVQKLSYEATAQTMRDEYGLEATDEEYQEMMHIWTTHDLRRKSLGDEGDIITKGKGAALFQSSIPYINGQNVDNETDLRNASGSTPSAPPLTTAADGSVSGVHPLRLDNYSNDSEVPGPQRPCQQQHQCSLVPVSSQDPSSQLPPMPTADPEDPNTDSDLNALASLYLPIFHLADERPDTTEEPPPYSADGWIWPEEPHDYSE